jgi:hypothetical protein
MTLTVALPDGRVLPLLKVVDWDFGWRNTYAFERPVDLPKGSLVTMEVRFDDASLNPRDPTTPPKPVVQGAGATDAISSAFLAVTRKGQDLSVPRTRDDPRPGQRR